MVRVHPQVKLAPLRWTCTPPEVQATVQQLVVEHGEYAPLELLLATNRLGYEDYRSWRECRLESLDAVLTDGERKTRAWLEGAQSWAEALGLTPEPAVHHGWEESSGAVLVASVDPPRNALLGTRFRHAPGTCSARSLHRQRTDRRRQRVARCTECT